MRNRAGASPRRSTTRHLAARIGTRAGSGARSRSKARRPQRAAHGVRAAERARRAGAVGALGSRWRRCRCSACTASRARSRSARSCRCSPRRAPPASQSRRADRRSTSTAGGSRARRARSGSRCSRVPVLVLGVERAARAQLRAARRSAVHLLRAGLGVALASLAGACLGALPRCRGLRRCSRVLLPVADMLRAIYDFYATPAVFAYGHFFGYFPGTLTTSSCSCRSR